MTNPSLPYKDLIARLEKASAPARELDREILFAIFPKDRAAIIDGVKHISTMTGADGTAWFLPLDDRQDCPHYTGSLDDAVTLVPPDMYWHIDHCRTRDDEPFGGASIIEPGSLDTLTEAEAPTAIIALCIASLEARALKEREGA